MSAWGTGHKIHTQTSSSSGKDVKKVQKQVNDLKSKLSTLDTSVNLIENSGFITSSDIPTIPTNNNQLTNGANYITSADIPSIPTNNNQLTNGANYITSADIPTIPTKTSDITNDSGFITSSDIPSIPTNNNQLTNGSNYITSADIPTIPTNNNQLSNGANYITSADIPSIPTNNNQLTNGANYITSADIPSIPTNNNQLTNGANYITSADIPSIPTNNNQLTNGANYITSSNPAIPTKVSDITNDLGFITNTAIVGFITAGDIPSIPTNNNELTNGANYITSADIPSIPTNNNELTNGANYITAADIPTIPTPTASDSTKVITVNSGGNYELGTGATSTYDTTFTSGTLEAVGGIPLNTPANDLVGQSITTILDMMLYPVQNPTIKQPNASISLTKSGLQIIGDTLNHIVKFTFHSNDNKVIKVDNSTEIPYSGVIKEASHDNFGSETDTPFLGTGTDGAFTSHTDIVQQTISRVVVEGVSTMTVKIKWENGTYQPLDSAGNNFSTTYATAADFLIKDSTVTGVYPRFLANSSGNFTQMTLKSHIENNQEFNQDYTETTDERHRFQISKSQYDAKTWEMEFFSTATNAFEDLIGGFDITNVDKSIESVDVSYIQYTRIGDEGGSTKYRLKF